MSKFDTATVERDRNFDNAEFYLTAIGFLCYEVNGFALMAFSLMVFATPVGSVNKFRQTLSFVRGS